jgi:hypothetical protein
VPIIANFFGILVRMRHGDHAPPHIHVEYQGHRAWVEIATGAVKAGSLPRKVSVLVREWCLAHRTELLEDWQLAQAYEPLRLIPGADHD